VRGKRGRGERRLERALAALDRALSASGAPWTVIGGIAVIARGVRRMTTDLDAVVRGDAISLDALFAALARRRIEPRIAGARDFAQKNLVLLLRHAPTGVDLDVSLGWTVFEHEAIAASPRTRYGEVEVPIALAEDLVVFKAMAARPKDVADAAALLALHGGVDLARVRRRLVELADLAGEPELVAVLEEIVATARAAAPGRAKGRRPVRRPKS
jgi:hypothetical protein